MQGVGTRLGEGALEGGERAFDRPASVLAEEGASEHALEFAAEFRILMGRLGRVDHRRTAVLDATRQLRDGGNVAWRRLERVAEQANEQQLEAVVLERRAARVLKLAVDPENIVEVLQACGRIMQRATLRRGQRLRVEREVEGVLFAVEARAVVAVLPRRKLARPAGVHHELPRGNDVAEAVLAQPVVPRGRHAQAG